MTDNIKAFGELEIKIYDKNYNLKRVYKSKNQITNAGFDLGFTRGLGTLLKTGGDLFGQLYTIDSFMGYRYANQYRTNESALNIGLLNIGNSKNNLNMSSSIANFYNSEFNSLDNVIGYAGINLTPSGNKEGKLSFSRGQSVAAGYTRSIGWEFPVNVAGGTFDVAVLTSNGILNTPYPTVGGVATYKCIDKVNVFDSSFVSMSTAYCPPGVTGVTSNSEILLNFNNGVSDKWKYNISTGEITQVEDGTPFFTPIDINIDDWFIEGTYLYTITHASTSAKVKVWDITTQTQIDSFSVSAQSNTYAEHYKFLSYNGNVYVTMNSINDSSSATRRCWTLSKGSSGFYSSATSGTSIQETIGITLPSGLPVNQVAIGNYGGNYIVYIGDTGVIVSDITNIQSSIIDVVPFVYPSVVGYGSGFISIGAPGANDGQYTGTSTINNTDSLWLVNGTGSSNTVSLFESGIMLMTNKHWGTMTSYFIFSSPITKSDDEIMTAGWVYGFTSNTQNGTVG